MEGLARYKFGSICGQVAHKRERRSLKGASLNVSFTRFCAMRRSARLSTRLAAAASAPRSTVLLRTGIQATNDYQRLLFASRDQFVDAVVMDESRTSISQRLAALAATLDGVEEEAVMERLKVIVTDTQKNSGSASIRVLKFYVKQHRQLGIHVTPTCRINGMIVETSSSWTLKEWQDYLDPMISLSEGGYKRN